MNDRVKWILKTMGWIAAVVVAVIAILGITCGKVIEGSLIAEIGKWVVMGLFVLFIVEFLAYWVLNVMSHFRERYMEKYDDWWFWHWLKNDSANSDEK